MTEIGLKGLKEGHASLASPWIPNGLLLALINFPLHVCRFELCMMSILFRDPEHFWLISGATPAKQLLINSAYRERPTRSMVRVVLK